MRVICVFAALCVAGCTSAYPGRAVHHGYRARANVADVPVHGYTVQVEMLYGQTVQGELLAVEDRTLFVAVEGAPVEVPVGDVRAVHLDAYENGGLIAGETAATSVLLASTASHGWWVIFSAPVVGSTYTAAGLSAAGNNVVARGQSIIALRQYARFPQGRPGHVLPMVDLGLGHSISTAPPPAPTRCLPSWGEVGACLTPPAPHVPSP